MQFVELPPTMRPAARQRNALIATIGADQLVVNGIAVDLENAAIAVQMTSDALTGSTILEAIGHHRRTGSTIGAVIPVM